MVRRFTTRTVTFRSRLRVERLDARLAPSASGTEDVLSLPHLTGMSNQYPTDDTPAGYTHSPKLDAEPVADDTPGGYSPEIAEMRLLDTPSARLAVATGAGQTTVVNVFDGPTGAMLGTITPFGDRYTAGARVATGDVTGDGVPDIVVASGPGIAPQVKVFDGKTLTEVSHFAPYEASFTGGVFVAVGDVTGDGKLDLVTTAGAGGGPLVKVFDPVHPGTLVKSFYVYEPEFRGGASLAVGDVDGDGVADIVTGAGAGGGPRVVVTSGKSGERLQDFFAFEPGARGGLSVAVGDLAGKPTIATALADGAGNQVRLYADGVQTALFTPFDPQDGKPQYHTPASVSLKDLTGDGRPELIVATPAGQGQLVRVVDPLTGSWLRSLPAVTPDYSGGLFVA